MIRLGVTGTDTGVGKTLISTVLLRLLRSRGLRVSAMKPVESGVKPHDPSSDARRLHAAAGADDPIDDVRPLLLAEPLAPWVASNRAGTEVDLGVLDAAFARLCEGRDAVLVEGAGGLLVPITRDVAFDGLFVQWELDVVVVAGNRLGAINHTLLTVRAAHDAGLRVRGVVLNALDAEPPGIAEATNLEALSELLAPVPVLSFPWLRKPDDEAYVLDIARERGLDRLLGDRTPPA
ncbi:MAG TPA: dethiobiotin synthase [Longimicrobium sp.]|jgi:dethiobiotin synthetase